MMEHPSRRQFLQMIGAGVAASGLTRAQADDRPNILLIMADDMGFADIGCYGGEIETPHLDALAARGLRFTQFYNNAKCGPTRSSLLTGLYNWQCTAGGDGQKLEHAATFAEALRPAGYRTLMTGKWHNAQLPTDRGFDRYFGLADGACNYFNPGVRRPGEPEPGRKTPGEMRRWGIDGQEIRGFTPTEPNWYATDAFTDHALAYLDQDRAEAQPWLLYVAYTAPHYPLHAFPEDIAKYRGRYLKGWDKLREERWERQIAAGLVRREWGLSPRDDGVPAWETVDNKDEWDLKMAVYAAMIDRMDRNIGRLLARLRETGQEENTVVLFLSDNGGCAETVHTTPDIPPGSVASYRTVDRPWANASNTPFRRFKRYDYEGGLATPLIARWPKVIAPGTITHQPGHIIDLMATFCDIGRAAYPTEAGAGPVLPLVGRSLRPIFEGRQREPHEALYWQFGPSRAIRRGDLKAVQEGRGAWELYDLAADRCELRNLANQRPTETRALAEQWQTWFEGCQRDFQQGPREA